MNVKIMALSVVLVVITGAFFLTGPWSSENWNFALGGCLIGMVGSMIIIPLMIDFKKVFQMIYRSNDPNES
ncbi:hypothetical protein [Thermoactinomyces sp. DSM 45892]|uniref:hypothetical protein n=1 Tax=Thermoactinomyces sp. DSM 45892 TaxID=1882753 RepID=UPI00089B2438|nr:hypothetical protein [Thermoactinomyces sp. DSM 45892]SDX92811.1 hypothetical protein SAMN05444416_10129 [Thermoactinomyces sp. DSM 45892]